MNLLGHILAGNSTPTILRTFDISEERLIEYKKRVDEIMDLAFSDRRVADLLLELETINNK